MSKRLRRAKYLKEIDSTYIDRDLPPEAARMSRLIEDAIAAGQINFFDVPAHIRMLANGSEVCTIRADGAVFYYVYRERYVLDAEGRRYDIQLH